MLVQALQTPYHVLIDVWLLWPWTTKMHQGSPSQCRDCTFKSCDPEHLERAWGKANGSEGLVTVLLRWLVLSFSV